jgi:hypothetical protein
VPRKPNPNPEWQPYAAGIRTPTLQKTYSFESAGNDDDSHQEFV